MKDKVAFITGISSGIGKATALEFAKKGVKLALTDINEKEGTLFTKKLKEEGANVLFIKADVCSLKDMEHAVSQSLEHFNSLDFAFNNAGITSNQAGFVKDCPEDVWLKVIDVNLNGVFRSMKAELAPMLTQKSGVIINNASVLGQVGFKAASSYVASKHAVIGLTKTAALEYSSKNIRVNAVCPGFILTPMVEKMGEKATQGLKKLHPIGRLGQDYEVAKTVIWLCSPEASFISGASINIDGAYTAQ